MKLHKKLSLFITTVSLYVILPAAAHSAAEPEEMCPADYSRLIRLYDRYFRLEENSFAGLTFTLAKQQLIKTGCGFKLTLVDNRGKHWIFKTAPDTTPVIAHRIYALFGVESPEIHAVDIILNGKPVKGTLQRHISPASTLDGLKHAEISPRGLNYLMKTQIVDWLIGDHDSSDRNFLVLSCDKDTNVDRLMRIDQDGSCLNTGHGDTDYSRPRAPRNAGGKNTPGDVYCRLRRSYAEKDAAPDIRRAYNFVHFIEEFPGPLFEANVRSALSGRKRALAGNFRDFYAGIDLPPDDAGTNSRRRAIRSIIESTRAWFHKRITALSGEIAEAGASRPAKPIIINAVASPDGFRIMRKFYEAYWTKRINKRAACFSALRALKPLRLTAPPLEKKALDIYSAELKNILRGKKTRFDPHTLNGLVNPSI